MDDQWTLMKGGKAGGKGVPARRGKRGKLEQL